MSERDGKLGKAVHQLNWGNLSDDDLLQFVDTHYRSGKARRLVWEGAATEQLAWVRGEQALRWDDEIRALKEEQGLAGVPLEYRLPVEINTLKGQVLQRIAMLLGRPVTWSLLPETGDDDDIAAARLGSRLLQWQWAHGGRSSKVKVLEAAWMLLCTGVIIPKIYWDADLGSSDLFGPAISAEEHKEPSLADTVRQKTSGFINRITGLLDRPPEDGDFDEQGNIELAQGEPVVEFRTGFDITEPPMCNNVDDAAWIIDSKLVTLEELTEQFGEKAVEKVVPDATSEAYHSSYKALYGQDPGNIAGGEEPAEMVMKHELWRPRSKSVPDGFFGVIAGEVVLKKGKHPYDHGRLPFARIAELPDATRFRPRCTVANLMKLQAARNRISSAANARVMMDLDPKMLAEKTAELPGDAMEPGPKVIPVADGAVVARRIVPFQLAPLPFEVFKLDERFAGNAQDVGGVHDATEGRKSDASESGRHAALLQAADQRRNSILRTNFETGMEEAGEQSLHLWYQYAATERMVTLGGEGLRREAIKFKGGDLSPGDPPGKGTFVVEVRLGLEPNLASALGQIETLTKLGYMNPQRASDQRRMRRLMGDDVIRADEDDESRERGNAAAEHDRLAAGKEQVVAALGDLDQVHIAEHEQWTTTEEYRRAVRGNPRLPGEIAVHIREHYHQAAYKKMRPLVIEKYAAEQLQVHYKGMLEEEIAKLSAGGGAGPMPGGGQQGPGGTPPVQRPPQIVPPSAEGNGINGARMVGQAL